MLRYTAPMRRFALAPVLLLLWACPDPVLPDVGESFFAPLKNLKPRGARVYLGVVHHMDGFKERIAMARKFLPDFGVAGYCGFGRVPPKDLPSVLKEHQQAIVAA